MKSVRTYRCLLILLAGWLLWGCSMSDREAPAQKEIAVNAVELTMTDSIPEANGGVPDTLSREELQGYMSIAVQKLKDYADYAAIATDQQYDKEFRQSARKELRRIFQDVFGHEKQVNYASRLLHENMNSRLRITVDSISISEFPQLADYRYLEEHTVYTGQLQLKQTIAVYSLGAKEKATSITSGWYRAFVRIVRVPKKIGKAEVLTWEVILIDIQEKDSESA